MIIVLGEATAAGSTLDELIAASLAHVRRSRTEPGCLSHDVARDPENPNRLLFTERWADRADLERHFEVPASREFVATVRRCCGDQFAIATYATGDD
ncbi:MAG: antibiotic biosynthesis monooxygenase [Pseudonocardiales bacterium]|nr:MAG: antibiotic biosynthesis monooxygenase [Pseudonocardiales bacterium]